MIPSVFFFHFLVPGVTHRPAGFGVGEKVADHFEASSLGSWLERSPSLPSVMTLAIGGIRPPITALRSDHASTYTIPKLSCTEGRQRNSHAASAEVFVSRSVRPRFRIRLSRTSRNKRFEYDRFWPYEDELGVGVLYSRR